MRFKFATPHQTGKPQFWQQIAGEWWRPKGPAPSAPVPDVGGTRLRPTAQGWKPFLDYSAFMPSRRLRDGTSTLWIDTLDTLPVTAYPLLLPRVARSALQLLGAYRTSFQVDVGPITIMDGQRRAYPRALYANTRVDMRWKVGGRLYAQGTLGAPADVLQPGYNFNRRALQVPRYSTIPNTTRPRQAPTT